MIARNQAAFALRYGTAGIPLAGQYAGNLNNDGDSVKVYQRGDYLRAVELIATGGVVTAPLESKHFAMNDYLEAYHFIEAQGEKSLKVFIDIHE